MLQNSSYNYMDVTSLLPLNKTKYCSEGENGKTCTYTLEFSKLHRDSRNVQVNEQCFQYNYISC